jgi:hypothetical protein
MVFMIAIVVLVVTVTMMMVLGAVLIVHYLAGGMNYFARRFHFEDQTGLSPGHNFLLFRMAWLTIFSI